MTEAKKITIKHSMVPADTVQPILRAGDTIETGVSHQLKINRDESWVSYKVTTTLGPDETAESAHARALNALNFGIESAVNSAVESVERMSK